MFSHFEMTYLQHEVPTRNLILGVNLWEKNVLDVVETGKILFIGDHNDKKMNK